MLLLCADFLGHRPYPSPVRWRAKFCLVAVLRGPHPYIPRSNAAPLYFGFRHNLWPAFLQVSISFLVVCRFHSLFLQAGGVRTSLPPSSLVSELTRAQLDSCRHLAGPATYAPGTHPPAHVCTCPCAPFYFLSVSHMSVYTTDPSKSASCRLYCPQASLTDSRGAPRFLCHAFSGTHPLLRLGFLWLPLHLLWHLNLLPLFSLFKIN